MTNPAAILAGDHVQTEVEAGFNACKWRIAIQAAIGSSNNPWQWLCQR